MGQVLHGSATTTHATIAKRFRTLHDEHKGHGFGPLIADERFTSWVAQPHMRAILRSMAVNFRPNSCCLGAG